MQELVHFFSMLKREKYLNEMPIYAFTKTFFPGLPNLDARLRCAKIGIPLSKRT